MKTTINKIRVLNPCVSGYQNLLNQLGDDFDKDKEFEVSSLVGGKSTIGDITWLLGKTDNKRALVEFAVLSAELALPIYEKTKGSKAPRRAIELVMKWLNDKDSVTKQELRGADAAAAVVTAYAADAAAYAAAAAAAGAAYAADAAAGAAYAAAYAAAAAAGADAAGAAAIKKQINDNFIRIIDSIR